MTQQVASFLSGDAFCENDEIFQGDVVECQEVSTFNCSAKYLFTFFCSNAQEADLGRDQLDPGRVQDLRGAQHGADGDDGVQGGARRLLDTIFSNNKLFSFLDRFNLK